MIAASLLVIALIITLLFDNQREAHEREIRAQGVALARVLSGLSLEQLIPFDGGPGVLKAISVSRSDDAFAYASTASPDGSTLHEITARGVVVPQAEQSSDPRSWLGTSEYALPNLKRNVIEFHAPVFDDGQLTGHVRLAYFTDNAGISQQQLQFFAMLALPIFLLTPIFFFFLRRELGPLRRMGEQLGGALQEGNLQRIELEASGELGVFIRSLNDFLERTGGRFAELESEQARLITSTKLLSYKKTRIERILESLPETVLVLDDTGTVCYANTRVAAVFGKQIDGIIARQPEEWCKNDELLQFLNNCSGQRPADYLSKSFEFQPEQDPQKTIAASAYPLFSPNDDSPSLGTLIVFRDITLEVMARNARGEFVAHVAHELKAPLNVLGMYSESLQGEDGDNEEFRIEAHNVIRDEVERLSDLIGNLLSITKIEMGSLAIDRQRVRLGEMLEDTFEAVKRGARRDDIKFEIDLPKNISPIVADKALLRIAVNNLLTNAIKYNRPDGTVSLSVDESDGELKICVRDTGIGIEAEERERVFEKFYRSELEPVRAVRGHGLGLALARNIVQLHHGDLAVDSEPGEWTEFTIRLWKDAEAIKLAI